MVRTTQKYRPQIYLNSRRRRRTERKDMGLVRSWLPALSLSMSVVVLGVLLASAAASSSFGWK